MSWEKAENDFFHFFCDTPGCKVTTRLMAVDFVGAWAGAQELGWRSFKRRGRPWDYFCEECALDAETAHREYNRQEQERERIKARNAY
jgi:hypothetical protein